MSLSRYLNLFLLTILSSTMSSHGQQEFIHPLTNMPPSSPDIETSYYFPGYTDQKFPIGETVTAICHVSNNGDSPYNITAIMGSLNSPFDFSFHIQNYSYKPLGVVVRPGEEISFSYPFQIHSSLEPVEYALAHTVFYESERNAYSNTFFNQTIELYYSSSGFDLETLGPLFFALASTVAIAYATFYLCTLDKAGKVTKKAATKLQRNPNLHDDWLIEKVAKKSKRSTSGEDKDE